MNLRVAAPLVLVGALLGAAGFAMLRPQASPAEITSAPAPQPAPLPPPGAHADPASTVHGEQLPPNHPPIDNATGPHAGATGAPGAAAGMGAMGGGGDENPAITWKTASAWKTAPNPNPMRLETWKLPATKGDTEEGELAISRAGGSVDANIDRWLGMFGEHDKEAKSTRTVAGLKVSVLDVTGTYKGAGAMMGADSKEPAEKKNWTFLGAIVETSAGSYFFKLTGPAATVKANRTAFDAMIDGIKPTK